MGQSQMHYAPMGMHPMGQRANMPPVPHGMMPQMMPPMGGTTNGTSKNVLFCIYLFTFACGGILINKEFQNLGQYLQLFVSFYVKIMF